MKLSLLTKKRNAIMEITFIIVFINNFEAPFKLLLVLLLSLPIDHKRIKSKRCYETSFCPIVIIRAGQFSEYVFLKQV